MSRPSGATTSSRSLTDDDPLRAAAAALLAFCGLEPRQLPRLLLTDIREDRILHEAHATSGDVRRLIDLFGLSVDGAQRYTATVDHPAIRRFLDAHGWDL